jgi:hypothetical protein
VIDAAGGVEPELEGRQEFGQPAGRAEGGEPLVDGLPRAVPAGQIPPRAAGAEPVEHPAEGDPVILPLAAPPGWGGREEGGEDGPLGVGEVASVHDRLEARLTSNDSADRAEFVVAVMAAPLPGTPEYHEAVATFREYEQLRLAAQ